MSTEIGAVIQPGESIPEDVTGFIDADRKVAFRDKLGIQFPWRIESCEDSGGCATHDADEFMFPLKVTAVREQPAEPERGAISSTEAQDPQRVEFPDLYDHVHHFGDMAARLQLMALFEQRDKARTDVEELRAEVVRLSRCETGPDGVTCVVDDSGHRDLYHGGSALQDVRAAFDVAAPAPVLAQVGDVITEGPACWKCGLTFGEIVDRGAGAYADGRLRYMHAYGNCPTVDELPAHGLTVTAVREPEPADEPDPICDARTCEKPGHHHTEPQPESDLLDLVRRYGAEMERTAGAHMSDDDTGPLLARIEAEVQRLRDKQAWLRRELVAITGQRDEALADRDRVCRSRDFMANQVIAPARDALTTAGVEGRTRLADRIAVLVGHRDEALAEVERLKAEVRTETEISDEYADWASKLAHAAVERLDVPITEEAHTELWEAALDALRAPAPVAAPGRTERALGEEGGLPLWHHDCGHVAEASIVPTVSGCCVDGIEGAGVWRPLLVATESAAADPAVPGMQLVREYGDEMVHYGETGEQRYAESASLLLDRIARHLGDEERSSMQVLKERDENAEWADRLALAVAEYLGVDVGEHSNANLPWQAALIALEDAAAPDPLVLRLPEGMRQAVALQGAGRWVRSERVPHKWVQDGAESPRLIRCLCEVLLEQEPEGVRVELAPPREPRTWPKLGDDDSRDELPARIEVAGASYRRAGDFSYLHEATGGLWDWWSLRGRGDVTEVFDDEAGNR